MVKDWLFKIHVLDCQQEQARPKHSIAEEVCSVLADFLETLNINSDSLEACDLLLNEALNQSDGDIDLLDQIFNVNGLTYQQIQLAKQHYQEIREGVDEICEYFSKQGTIIESISFNKDRNGFCVPWNQAI